MSFALSALAGWHQLLPCSAGRCWTPKSVRVALSMLRCLFAAMHCCSTQAQHFICRLVFEALIDDLCPSSVAQEVIRSLWKVLDHMGVSQAQVCLLEIVKCSNATCSTLTCQSTCS